MGPGGAKPPPQEGPSAADGLASLQARRLLTASDRLDAGKRLRRTADIRRVLRYGKRRGAKHLELIWTENEAGQARMGLIVPKFHHTAVARNRLRRRLREIWRTRVQGGQGAKDLLIKALPGAYEAPFEALTRDLLLWREALGSID